MDLATMRTPQESVPSETGADSHVRKTSDLLLFGLANGVSWHVRADPAEQRNGSDQAMGRAEARRAQRRAEKSGIRRLFTWRKLLGTALGVILLGMGAFAVLY